MHVDPDVLLARYLFLQGRFLLCREALVSSTTSVPTLVLSRQSEVPMRSFFPVATGPCLPVRPAREDPSRWSGEALLHDLSDGLDGLRPFCRITAADRGKSGEPLQPGPVGVSASQHLLAISDEKETRQAWVSAKAREDSRSLVRQPHGTKVADGIAKGATFG